MNLVKQVASLNINQSQRLVFIDVILYWEGNINSTRVKEQFQISSRLAKADIAAYQAMAGNNLEYDPSKKHYKSTAEFQSVLNEGQLSTYLEFKAQRNDGILEVSNTLIDTSDIETSQDRFVKNYTSPLIGVLHNQRSHVDPELFRFLLKACKEKQVLEIDYRSVSKPEKEGRLIQPHTLVFAGHRWHVRAYCQATSSYRDFVLSRVFELPTVENDNKYIKVGEDQDWIETETVTIRPDKRLQKDQQEIVEWDYNMTDGKLEIKLRRAHIKYLINDLNIDEYKLKEDPRQQQITIDNIVKIRKIAFRQE